MQAGFVGLGKMGRPMTQRLLGAGHTVHVFNRSRGAIDALVAEGATAAESAAAGGRARRDRHDRVADARVGRAVYAELTGAARAGQIYVDHSTVSPGTNRACAEQLAAKGAAFLDAPVLGRPWRCAGRHADGHGRRRAGRASTRRCPSCRPSARTFSCAVRSARARWSS